MLDTRVNIVCSNSFLLLSQNNVGREFYVRDIDLSTTA